MSRRPVSCLWHRCHRHSFYTSLTEKKTNFGGIYLRKESEFFKNKPCFSHVSSRSAQKCNVRQTGVMSDTGVSDIASYISSPTSPLSPLINFFYAYSIRTHTFILCSTYVNGHLCVCRATTRLGRFWKVFLLFFY
jgi:hypothetical protein